MGVHHENQVIDHFVEHVGERAKQALAIHPDVSVGELDQIASKVMADLANAGVKIDDPASVEQILGVLAALHVALAPALMRTRDEGLASLLVLGALTYSVLERGKTLKVIQ